MRPPVSRPASATPSRTRSARRSAVADRLPVDAGSALSGAAAHAYSDALGIGLLAAAGAAFVGAFLTLRYLPARHRGVSEPRVAQSFDETLVPAGAGRVD